MKHVALELDGFSAGYGGVPVVRDVSLAVERGEVLAIVGRNGVGKTTLVDGIVGLVESTSGRVVLDGRDLTLESAARRARAGLAYVPQGRGIFPRMSVEDNLRMGDLIGDRSDRSDIERVFEWFPVLHERRRQSGDTLSGGEQQMLAIGRAMVGSPSVLLLDEPSEGIQPSIVQAIAQVLMEQNQEAGLTVLLVEQNIDLVYLMADRSVVMDNGAIQTWLEPEELADAETARRYLAI